MDLSGEFENQITMLDKPKEGKGKTTILMDDNNNEKGF